MLTRYCLLLVALAGLPIPPNAAIAQEKKTPESSAPRELLGCWRAEEDRLLRFLPEKCHARTRGRLLVYRARYEPGVVVLQALRGKNRLRYTLEGDSLTILPAEDRGGADAKPVVYRRLAEVPAALELRPLPLGKPGTVPPDVLNEIQDELARRVREDQAVRKDPARRSDMRKVDTDNTAWLVQLVGEHGWIDATRFGARASNAAFLMVQHSGNLPLMLAALPEIEKDVRAKRLDAQPYALLYDRTMLYVGEYQRYGTQILPLGKVLLVLPMEDPEHVEQRRKELGLFSLERYLSFFKRGADDVKVRFADWNDL